MEQPDWYQGKEVLILGLAKSGAAAAKLFHDAGAQVTANDMKPREQCPEAESLEAEGIRVICGGHPKMLVHPNLDLIVKNPGIPYSNPLLLEAQKLEIDIVSEVEVAGAISSVPIIGITGSNGKTTTTSWIGRMLEQSNFYVRLAGNIGTPLSIAAAETQKRDYIVAELSSFQLKGTTDFHPYIACLLNIYETHLDYHGTMQDYIGSKMKIFQNQTETDYAVINWDDKQCRSVVMLSKLKSQLLPFSMKEPLEYGVFVELCRLQSEMMETVVYRDCQGRKHPIIDVREIGLLGRHNLENALAAAAVSIAAGASLDAVKQSLKEFGGVEHRQELVKTLGGVSYYNDSKATNPAATQKAIEALPQPIVWVCGGLMRGNDFTVLEPLLRRKVKAVVAFGQTRNQLKEAAEAAGIQHIALIEGDASSKQETMLQAVRTAFGYAVPGDTVLLSPACASWDMFTSFEERGGMFKESVHTL